MITSEDVLQSIRRAFEPLNLLTGDLHESHGMIIGHMTVHGSDVFNGLDDARRQARLWKQYSEDFKAEDFVSHIGPIVLNPTTRH